MWYTTKDWLNNSVHWMKCSWFELSGDLMSKEVQSYKNKFSRVKKFFKNNTETENLVIHIDTFLNDIKEFEK